MHLETKFLLKDCFLATDLSGFLADFRMNPQEPAVLDELGLTLEELLLIDIKSLNRMIKERNISDEGNRVLKELRRRLNNR